MGCDGQISAGNTIVETSCIKVFRLKDGALVGFAGNVYNWQPILDYFNSDKPKKKWPSIEGVCDTLVLEPDGQLFMYDTLGRSFRCNAPRALGSGWQYALAALKCGADVRAAIEVACELDAHSSGTITVVDV